MMRYTISVSLASLLLAAPALAEVPRVVTDLPPVQSLVAQVMGDLGGPEVLLDRGGDPHSFQLRPSQARALAQAGLVIWVGPEMSPWLARALGEGAPQLRLAEVPGTHRQDYAGAGDHEDHDHDDGDGDADHDHEDHDHTGLDPHLWLDPGNAALWLSAIAADLGRLDPEHAATYAANAETARLRLSALDAELQAELAPVQGQPFYVFHQAYGYFAGHYGLTIAGSISAGDAASPGAAHLAELRADMAGTPRCIFPEGQHDPRLAAQIAAETGARLGAPLDPEGSTLKPGPGLYETLMRGLATTIRACVAP